MEQVANARLVAVHIPVMMMAAFIRVEECIRSDCGCLGDEGDCIPVLSNQ